MSASPSTRQYRFERLTAVGAVLLCALLCLETTHNAEAKVSTIACSSTGNPQTGDQVTHSVRGKVLTVKVTLRRGIGGAKVSWAKKDRPETIIVELRKFHNLEAFSMSSGEHRFQTALRTAPMIWGRDSASDTDEHELQPKVSIVQKADKIVATVPKEAFDWPVNELHIGWIDAYR